LAVVVSACARGSPSGQGADALQDDAITVGSFDFSESEVLAELYSQALESKGYRVVRALNLGPREFVEPALERGLIEFVPEYLGTVLGFLTGPAGPDATSDVQATHERLVREFATRGISVMASAPAQDTNGIAVTRATAVRFDLKTVSDLAPVAGNLVFGGPPECPERPLCLPGLMETYGLDFERFTPLDASGPLTIAALASGQVDVALVFTTDGSIDAQDLVLLDDDRGLQPADNVTPVARHEVLGTHGPGFASLVDTVSALLTTEDLRALNGEVRLARRTPHEVAGGWLERHPLA